MFCIFQKSIQSLKSNQKTAVKCGWFHFDYFFGAKVRKKVKRGINLFVKGVLVFI
jgi:hypothetical protein